MIVVAATIQHGDAFCHRYLHAVDVVAVPHRLENRVGEPENQQILDHLFAQVMVDPVDLALVENLRHSVIQLTVVSRSVPNGVSITTLRQPPLLSASPDRKKILHCGNEIVRRNGELVQPVRVLAF